jgi:hypothetical protein
VCVYVCVYVDVYVCVYVSHVCACTCAFTCTCACTCACGRKEQGGVADSGVAGRRAWHVRWHAMPAGVSRGVSGGGIAQRTARGLAVGGEDGELAVT